jgi:hypothetical protein
MKADLCAELSLLNRNVDEMIRLFQCATDAGIWTRREATGNEARLELLRAKLNADFKELMFLRERTNRSPPSMQDAHPLTKKQG